jgi:tetratricopeptide (TPR) repeat protein
MIKQKIKVMKYIFTILLMASLSVQGQEQTSALLQETARTLLQKGDFDNAVIMLDRAKQQDPNNVEIMRDLSYVNYLKRDFAKAIEAGKELVENPKADAQAFQLLGLSYKAIASYKECGKLYRTGLRKFPNSGVLYNEYGELFALENELDESIGQWEKGIEVDPVYSGNYYNASLFHARKNNWIRAALYGEMFLNLESYTKRTQDVKNQLLAAWRNMLVPTNMQQLKDARSTSAFERSVLDVLAKSLSGTKGTGSIDDLIAVRAKFIEEWMKENGKAHPFQLFSHQQYLLKQNIFSAYNNWLFSASADSYEAWTKEHTKEAADFTAFQQSRVFKLPAGEYYFGK